MPAQAVIDTNVLVAAARSNAGASFELLRLFAAGDTRWEWNISTALLLEYEAVLKREQHRFGRSLEVIDRFLDDIAARANRNAVFYLMRPFLSDPDDELILEVALASGSDYIVTHNRDDFRDAERFGLRVLTPVEFLRIL
ncbi:MAG: putative toxin-antitoxin system toxin component, PIN family [Verrucomicrobia bacterium]|nr:MAG: putative toxin-antitoxin system toxin component, PIN family [Verrucomicrobiota bacterium]